MGRCWCIPRSALKPAGFRLTTNNRMEIQAAIKGLELLKQPCKVTLYGDSQYLVDAMMKGWAAKWKRNNWWLNKRERAKNGDAAQGRAPGQRESGP